MQTNTTITIRLNLPVFHASTRHQQHANIHHIGQMQCAHLGDNIIISNDDSIQLTAKLQSITDNTENSINVIREEAKQERLHIQAQGQATQLQRYYEQRTSIMADIELLDCEAEESVAAGQPTPRTLVVKHRQLHSQLTKLQEQISITRTCLLNMCQQLHVDISVYINEE